MMNIPKMRDFRRIFPILPAVALAVLLSGLSGCSTDSYDTGTGEYSLTQADFVEAHSVAGGYVDYVLTDGGASLMLTEPVAAGWAAKADTLYRAVLFYNLQSDSRAEAVSLSSIPVLVPKPADEFETISTDPVRFESLWLSTSGKFINAGIYLKSGQIDEGAELHTLGLIDDGTADNPDGTRTACLRLYHDQGDVPEYYSSRFYISIACQYIDADTVAIGINTYDGWVERRMPLPR